MGLITFILIILLHPANLILAGLLALTFIFILFPVANLGARAIKIFLVNRAETDYYTFAVLGLALFIASNIIQITGGK